MYIRRTGTSDIWRGTTRSAHDDREEDRAPREAHPGEGVRGVGRDRDRDDHRRDSDDKAVDEGVEHPLGVEDRRVILERPRRAGREGVEHGIPPAVLADVVDGPEGADEQPGRRHRPGDGDEDDGHPDGGPPEDRAAHRRAATGGPGAGVERRSPGRHRPIPCRRRLRMFTIMIGTTARKRITAIADARPKFRKVNISANMRLARTSVSKRPPVMT